MVGFSTILGGFFSVVGSAGVPPIVTAFSGANVFSTNSTDLTLGSVTLEFDTENFDIGDYFNIGNPARLTAPVNGVYWIATALQFDTIGDVTIAFLLNGGTPFTSLNKPTTLPDTVVNAFALVQLTAGDFVTLLVNNTGGGTVVSQGADNSAGNPNFLIALLGTT